MILARSSNILSMQIQIMKYFPAMVIFSFLLIQERQKNVHKYWLNTQRTKPVQEEHYSG